MLTIHAIRGRTLRVKDSDSPEELLDYEMAQKPNVSLNGEQVTLAALDNGDVVQFSNGKKDGWHEVHATRSKRKGTPIKPQQDRSKPVPVHVPQAAPQDPPVDPPVQTTPTTHPPTDEEGDSPEEATAPAKQEEPTKEVEKPARPTTRPRK